MEWKGKIKGILYHLGRYFSSKVVVFYSFAAIGFPKVYVFLRFPRIAKKNTMQNNTLEKYTIEANKFQIQSHILKKNKAYLIDLTKLTKWAKLLFYMKWQTE